MLLAVALLLPAMRAVRADQNPAHCRRRGSAARASLSHPQFREIFWRQGRSLLRFLLYLGHANSERRALRSIPGRQPRVPAEGCRRQPGRRDRTHHLRTRIAGSVGASWPLSSWLQHAIARQSHRTSHRRRQSGTRTLWSGSHVRDSIARPKNRACSPSWSLRKISRRPLNSVSPATPTAP